MRKGGVHIIMTIFIVLLVSAGLFIYFNKGDQLPSKIPLKTSTTNFQK